MPAQYHAAEVVWVFRVWLETVSALSERNCEAMYGLPMHCSRLDARCDGRCRCIAP